MSELSMGPLPARSGKDKQGKNVYRCGVRDCPFILATVTGGELGPDDYALELPRDFDQRTNGRYAKSAASGNRFTRSEQKQQQLCKNLAQEKQREEEIAAGRTERYRFEQPGDVSITPYELTQEKKRVNPSRLFLADNDLPAIITCERCGRDSKISCVKGSLS
jgi:hypothetical protein